jgi:periplasmic divalent cation tolerance protein
MKATRRHQLVLVTVPNRKTGRQLARAALEARVVACASLVPSVESHYWWDGRLEVGRELQVWFKTRTDRVGRLWDLVRSLHPYEVPEFLVLPVRKGSARYLDWVDACLDSQSDR